METAIIIALIGGLGGIITAVTTAIFKILEWRKAQKGETWEAALDKKITPLLESHAKMQKELEAMQNELKEVRLDTTRTQLYFKIEHDTHNYDTILKIASRYFVDLHGDWVATVDFLAWAEREKIKVPQPILDAIAKNDQK